MNKKDFAILSVCYSVVNFVFVCQIDGAVKGGIVHESMPVHPPKPPSEPKPTPRTPRGSTSPRKVKAANSSSDDFDNQQQNGNSGNRVSSDQSQQVASPPVPASPPSPANRAPSRRLTRKRTPDDEDDDNSVNNDISERPHQMQVEQRTVTSAGKKKRAYVKANQHAVRFWHELCLVVVVLHLSSSNYH